jgi:hypothetical protein
MFSFLRRSAPTSPNAAICRALEKEGLSTWVGSPSMLRIVQSRGRYVNRKVTFIRVFDPVQAAERALDIRSYGDLDSAPDLIVKSGHIEEDGTIVMNHDASTPAATTQVRTRAGRIVADVESDDARGAEPAGAVDPS